MSDFRGDLTGALGGDAPTFTGTAAPTGREREERRARANTRRVRRLRVLLPATGLVLAAVLATGALIPKLFPLAGLAGLSLTADGLVMHDPRLAGHLGGGRRYEVMADRAIQSLLTPSRLTLEGLDADVDMGEGERVTMQSAEAVYDTGTEVLALADGVQIASTDGNEASLDAATVYFKEGRVESDRDIEITSPRGRIRAGRIDIIDGGALIRFSGGVSITIDPAS